MAGHIILKSYSLAVPLTFLQRLLGHEYGPAEFLYKSIKRAEALVDN
jgi:hypothetical protein